MNRREQRAFAAEMKFVVPIQATEGIRQWARERMRPDPHVEDGVDTYRTASLYLDNDRMDVFHRRGSNGRSKYRIRRYGDSPEIFLERKLKTRGWVNKRRVLVPVAEVEHVRMEGLWSGWSGRWFARRITLRGLQPRCEIRYQRMACVADGPHGAVRLTLDTTLRARLTHGYDFGQEADLKPVIDADRAILELKYRVAPPALFKELMEHFGLLPAAFSKYRTAMGVLAGLEGDFGEDATGAEVPVCNAQEVA
jgi:hypothetical protein